MADHSSILACRIPWTEEPGEPQSMGSQRVGHRVTNIHFTSLMNQMVKNLPEMQETRVQFLGQEDLLEKGMATHYSILAWGIPQRSLVGCSPWGHKESDMTERLSLSLSSSSLL